MKKTRSYIISFAVLIILWELLAVSGLFPESLFPSPGRTAEALGRRISSGALLLDIGASMYRFFIGYILAVVSAVILGLLLGWFRCAWKYVNPIVQFLRPISPVAWLPFIVLWVGIGDVPAVVIIFIAAFFPVLLTTVTAVGSIDPVYLKISDNFGLSRSQTLAVEDDPLSQCFFHILLISFSLNEVHGRAFCLAGRVSVVAAGGDFRHLH